MPLQDQYRLIRDLSGGRTKNTVYLAEALDSSKRVTIKTITSASSGTSDGMIREIEAGKLEHPGIVRHLSTFSEAGRSHLVFEHIEGSDLHQMMSQRKWRGLKIKEFRPLASSLVMTLMFVHAQGFLHLDIKLDNIILAERDSKPHFIDFGNCQRWKQGEKLVEKYDASPDYVPPEVFHSLPYHSAADVWSLGVVFYILATGQLPFSRSLRMFALAFKDRCSIEWPAGIAGSLKSLIGGMLEDDVEKRLTLKQVLKHPLFDLSYASPSTTH